MTCQRYVKPVAVHRAHSEHLLMTDDGLRWYLWLGEEGSEPVAIPCQLARYLATRWEMQPLDSPCMWFMVSDLPVRKRAGSTQDITGSGFPA